MLEDIAGKGKDLAAKAEEFLNKPEVKAGIDKAKEFLNEGKGKELADKAKDMVDVAKDKLSGILGK
ncbi:MAG: hypothetical protein K2N03_02625 [Muribaculaceae bacterium]|nr:hypothetical protein [Muribaculaceae bacterium]